MSNWAEQEFGDAKLGDKRRTKRLVSLADAMAANAGKSIPSACSASGPNWADTQAAYRFLNNDGFDGDALFEAHRARTEERILASNNMVLYIEDTTELNFHKRVVEGLGELNPYQKGCFLHPAYCVDAQTGEALGIHRIWTLNKPSATKKSERWPSGMQSAKELQESRPGMPAVCYVSDREGCVDAALEIAGGDTFYVVRSPIHRVEESGLKIVEFLQEAGSLGKTTFTYQRERKVREVTQEVFMGEVTLKSGVTLTAVYTKDESDYEPVSWLLFTNLPLSASIADARKVIDIYRKRWLIEKYFDVLKNKCNAEDFQLRSWDTLYKAIVLTAIVAWRIAHLISVAKATPNAPASDYFSETELILLKKPDTLKKAVYAVAAFGGHLGRKNDPFPGPKHVALGLERLALKSEAFQLARSLICV